MGRFNYSPLLSNSRCNPVNVSGVGIVFFVFYVFSAHPDVYRDLASLNAKY